MGERSEDIIREVAMEHARHINEKVDLYHQQTNTALSSMADSMKEMAHAVTQTSTQLARHEERYLSQSDRMERIETTQKEQGKCLGMVRDEVKTNTTLRKAVLWLGLTLVAAMISGGVIFSDLTGKGPTG